MELCPTNKCNTLMNFFLSNNKIPHLANQEQAHPILKTIFDDLLDANKWIEEAKADPEFYHLKMANIRKEEDIPLSSHLQSAYIDSTVVNHIKKKSVFLSTYTIYLLDKTITIHFIFEKGYLDKKWKEPNIEMMNCYVDNMLLWLHVSNKHITNACANKLVIFVYLTSLEKNIPKTENAIISPNHVNTGITTSCPLNGEIAIYRIEEWFKVFIHESIHTLGLDFAKIDVKVSEDKIRETFYIPTPILLFEAYTEFWARVMNTLIVSFRWSEGDSTSFLSFADFLLAYERIHCVFQMNKLLTHMNLEYADLYTDSTLLDTYREETNAFVYYIITAILMSNYPEFIQWCSTNHDNLIQFKLTNENQLAFCEHIKTHFNSKNMLQMAKCSSKLHSKISILSDSSKSKKLKQIIKTLRMSLLEVKYSNRK
jgi:hypothetical protein